MLAQQLPLENSYLKGTMSVEVELGEIVKTGFPIVRS